MTRFRGVIPPCLGKRKEKKLLKWHTISSAGYFSPYNCTLNMVNKDTRWERRNQDENSPVVVSLPFISPACQKCLLALHNVVRPWLGILVKRASEKGNSDGNMSVESSVVQKWQVQNHADTLTDLFVKDCVEQQNFYFFCSQKKTKKKKTNLQIKLVLPNLSLRSAIYNRRDWNTCIRSTGT